MRKNLWESVKIHQKARTQTGSRPSGFFLICLCFLITPPRELKTKTVISIKSEIDFSRPAELLSVTLQLRFTPSLNYSQLLFSYGIGFGLNYVQLLFSYGPEAFVTG